MCWCQGIGLNAEYAVPLKSFNIIFFLQDRYCDVRFYIECYYMHMQFHMNGLLVTIMYRNINNIQ